MPKIKDRLVAGLIAGLGANVVKTLIEHVCQSKGLTKETAVKKAAGFFLSSRKANTPKGKMVGIFSDNTIAGFLGVLSSYMLTLTGKDYPVLKGMVIGNIFWSTMYGVMAQLGATKVRSNDPRSFLASMLSHTAFGITSHYLLTKIADPDLYQSNLEDQSARENITNQSTLED